MTIVPEKGFDVSLNLLQFPHEASVDEAGHPIPMPFPRVLRAVQIAQRLFTGGQLYPTHDPSISTHDPSILSDLLSFKWLDPIVATMAFLELRRHPETARRYAVELDEAAHNLVGYFGDLPDAKVAPALQCPICRAYFLPQLRHTNAVPVLAEAARHLAIMLKEEDGRSAPPLIARLAKAATWTTLDPHDC